MTLNLSSALSLPTTQTLPTRKLFKWLPDGSLELRIDWSSIESFLSCNRSAEYKLIHSRIAQPRSALIFGAAMHAALEVWYRNKHKIGKLVHCVSLEELPEATEGSMILKTEDIVRMCALAIERTYADYPAGFLGLDYRTSDFCLESFIKYLSHYQDEKIHPAVYQGKELVEFSFAMPLGQVSLPISVFREWEYGTLTDDAQKEEDAYSNIGATGESHLSCKIEWTGIIDMLADFSGECWLVDHKTTSILSQDFFDGFEFAMQPVGYVTAARQAFPDLNVKGFLINVLACRKPTAAVTKSGKASTAKSFEPFRRFYAYESYHENEFKKDALFLVEEMIANLTNAFFPRKTNWCIGKYGKCPYFEVCSLPPQHRLEALNSNNYTNNTWKPV